MTRKKIDDSPKTENSVAGAKSGYDLIEASLAGFDHVVPIETVIPYENNPRDNTDAVDPVAKSLWECGWCNAIAVESLEKRVIVAGHTRLLAAQKLGLKRVPVKPLDHLTPDKIRLYRLLDNRTHEFSHWMEANLQTELDFLTQSDFDMSEFGFSDMELNQILRDNDPVTEVKTDPDSMKHFSKNPDFRLTFPNGRNTVSPLRVKDVTVPSFQAGVVPGGDVKRKLFLCLDDLPLSVKRRLNYPAQGAFTTDRERLFHFKAGSKSP